MYRKEYYENEEIQDRDKKSKMKKRNLFWSLK